MINTYKNALKKNEEIDEKIYKEMLAKELILRDYLAIERTVLANESTFLSYVRTSLTLIAAGITLFHISIDTNIQYLGIFISILGLYAFIAGTFHSAKMKNKINDFVKRKNEAQEGIKEEILNPTK